MATYEYDGIELTIGGNEVIRPGDMIALDARGQAVLAYRARGTLTLDTSRSLSGRGSEDAIRAEILGDVPIGAGDAAISAAWERARPANVDTEALSAALRDLGSSFAVVVPFSGATVETVNVTSIDGYTQRSAWRRRLCASIDAAARKTPITAAELRERLFSRPLPRRRLRDGRLGPQAYAPEDPLPLP